MTEPIPRSSQDRANSAIRDTLVGAILSSNESESDILRNIQDRSNDLENIKFLTNWTDHLNTSLLWHSARNGHDKICSILLEHGANIDKARSLGGSRFTIENARNTASTPLMAAIAFCKYRAALRILRHYKARLIPLKPLHAGRLLLVLAYNCDNICDDSLPSKVATKLINLTGIGINEKIRIEQSCKSLPLISHAVAKEYANLVEKLLIDVRQLSNQVRKDAMLLAASLGNIDIVKLFFSCPDYRAFDKSTLSQAIKRACLPESSKAVATLSLLIEVDPTPNFECIHGKSAVSIASSKPDARLLKLILDKGGNALEGFESLGNNSSFQNLNESKECLTLLLKNLQKNFDYGDAWINKKYNGIPILSLVTKGGSEELVYMMLHRGADVNLADDEMRCTPLHWACLCNNINAVQALLNCGADLNLKTKDGYSALHLAVDRGLTDVVISLLDNEDTDINGRDYSLATPLMFAVLNACSKEKHEMVKLENYLLNERRNSVTPTFINPVRERSLALVRILVDAGADIECTDENGNSALSLAAKWLFDAADINVMKVLLNFEMHYNHDENYVSELCEKVKQYLKEGKTKIVAAYAVLMLQSSETRELITDTGLWEASPVNLSIPPANMLTWAIERESFAVKILLESFVSCDNRRDIYKWRCSLVLSHLKDQVSPLFYAVELKNSEALSMMLSVLKLTWSYRYSMSSMEKTQHPLDSLNQEDLVHACNHYPELIAESIKEAPLVPAYASVPGQLTHVRMANSSIWVVLTKARSPTAIWEKFINYFYNDIKDHQRSTEKSPRPFFIDRFRCTVLVAWGFGREIFEKWWNGMTFLDPQCAQTLTFKPKTMGNYEMGILANRIWIIDEDCFSDRYVSAYLIPVKRIASYHVLSACVRASAGIGSSVLFDSPILAAVVCAHWRHYGFPHHIIHLVLFCILLSAFILLTFQFKNWTNSSMLMRIFAWILQIVKVALSLYFLFVLEYRQIKHSRKLQYESYFLNIWNIIDIFAFGGILVGFVIQMVDYDSVASDGIHSIVTILLWFKFLDFLRPFRYFGPMIQLIFEVTIDVRFFLVILLVIMIGFGNSFYIILGNSSPESTCNEGDAFLQELCEQTFENGAFETQFKSMRSAFSYMLGTFDFTDLDNGSLPVLLTLIWGFYMALVAIILFNLLIAIISDSYKRVSSMKLSLWRLEQARVVVNIYSMLSDKDKEEWEIYVRKFPWLQVLLPDKLYNDRHDDTGFINDPFPK